MSQAHFCPDAETPSVSSGIGRLRQLLQTGEDATSGTLGIYAQAANGSMPVVVQVFNEVSYPYAPAHSILCVKVLTR